MPRIAKPSQGRVVKPKLEQGAWIGFSISVELSKQ